MRKINLKIIILTSVLVIVMLLLGATKSQAVLQANATTHASPVSQVGSAWIAQIRQMETAGQTMGLNETLSGLNATSESNHIDVHMMLPTEYGAIAILSASGYGNPEKLQAESNVQKRTTTGNSTGVHFTANRWELTACSGNIGNGKYSKWDNSLVGNLGAASSTVGWHGSTKWKRKYPTTGDYVRKGCAKSSYYLFSVENGLHSRSFMDLYCNKGFGGSNVWTGDIQDGANVCKSLSRGVAVIE